jgi:acetyl/propionyl-CoA carboxylase alpha subunit
MDFEFLVDGHSHKITLEQQQGKVIFTRNGRRMEVDVLQVNSGTFSLLVDGKSYVAHTARRGERIFVSVGASQCCLLEPKQKNSSVQFKDGSSEKAEGTIKAPMPGMVIKVHVAEGSEVSPGDGLVVVEAMKMEHEMRAAFHAIVEKVHVKAGQQVDAFQPLVELRAKKPAL